MIYIGIAVLVILFFINRKKEKKVNFEQGKKVAGLDYIQEDAYFKKKMRQYKIARWAIEIVYMITIMIAFILMARPYKTVIKEEEKYSRDILLCMDISTSVDKLNESLVKELQETVRSLKGERFGISIFNASSVLLTPLTEDYEHVTNILGELGLCLKENNYEEIKDNYSYYSNYTMSGTLVGVDERGSSLIGDGLASCVLNFPKLNEKRTRIVIFSTDNDPQGTEIVNIVEAADICKKHNVVVFGIGTKEMFPEKMAEMKKAVEKTGGKFYLEEEAGTMKQIVKAIDKEAKILVKGKQEIQKIEQLEIPFAMLSISVLLLMLFLFLYK